MDVFEGLCGRSGKLRLSLTSFDTKHNYLANVLDSQGLRGHTRVWTEEELAGSILFLVSRAGCYCNGQVLLFDSGGLSMISSTC